MTTPYLYCTCYEPMPNEENTMCLLCGLLFEPPPPALGVSVDEKINTGDQVGG